MSVPLLITTISAVTTREPKVVDYAIGWWEEPLEATFSLLLVQALERFVFFSSFSSSSSSILFVSVF